MQELISNMQTSLEVYRSLGKVILLLTGIIGLLTVKSNQRIRVIILYVIIGSLFVLNPFFVDIEVQLLGENKLYRLGMVLIIPILSAYALTVLYKKLTISKKRIIAMFGILVLVAASGRFVYTSNHFYQSNNEGKVYNLAVEIADSVTTSKEAPVVAISEVQGIFIRQYNANIRLICAPETTESWKEAEDEKIINMRAMLADSLPDMPALVNLANDLGCDYLVLMEQQVKEDSPQNYGFTYVDTYEKFQVFENQIGAK
jgi:hypothetical protein